MTIGLEAPGPGSLAFHFKFFFSLQVRGIGAVSALMPEPFGPRKRLQSPAETEWASMSGVTSAKTARTYGFDR